MQNKNKFLIGAAAVLITGGVSFAVAKQHYKAKQKVKIEAAIDSLQNENYQLTKYDRIYSKNLDKNLAEARKYSEENISSDNMDLLYRRVQKIDDGLNAKYGALTSDFLKKISKQGGKFCKRDGSYPMKFSSGYVDVLPCTIEDYMLILRENSKKIPNIAELEAEYKKLQNFGRFTADFGYFVCTGFQKYLEKDSEEKEFVSSVPQEKTGVIFPGGMVLQCETQPSLYVYGNIPPYNYVDNIIQNEIIGLTKMYFVEMVSSYGDWMDEKLIEQYRNSKDLMSQIQTLNEIEERAESARVMVNDLQDKIEKNKMQIDSLKHKLR